MKTATLSLFAVLLAGLLSRGAFTDDSILSADSANRFEPTSLAALSADAESASVAGLKQQFAAHERTSAQLAQQLRTAQKSYRDDHPEVKNLRSRLQSSVSAAFAVRQQLNRAQLEEFRRRMAHIEQFVDSRERARQEIIDRRVEELLNPDLKWPAEPSGTESTPGVSGPGPGVTDPQNSGVAVNPYHTTKPAQSLLGSGGAQKKQSARRMPSPDEAVVWIEAVFEQPLSDGKKQLVTAYMNGTVIRPDGLIATVFPEGVESSVMFKSATLFYQEKSTGNQNSSAALKAHDVSTGAALLQAEATDMPFIELSDDSVSFNKELALRWAYTSSSYAWGTFNHKLYRARVSQTGDHSDASRATFMFTTQPAVSVEQSEAGAALTTMSGRLQGLLAPSLKGSGMPDTIGPEGSAPARRDPEHPAVSVDVIRRLVERVKDQPMENSSDVEPKAGSQRGF